jgi:geranylgeranyl pyrophosphate synthase
MLATESHQQATMSINEVLHSVFDIHKSIHPTNRLIAIGKYALSTEGKMLRGCMLLEACRAVGGDPEEVLYAAAGTEYGHLASLVHDDIIDMDEIRRGKPSVWRMYGSDSALLTGDLFIFEAFHALSLCRHTTIPAERIVRVLEVLSTACIDLCLGQVAEERFIRHCTARSEDYIEMIRLKTSSLFRASLESGAILGGGTEKQIKALSIHGEKLGIIFQIVDDLLPYISSEQVTGKPKTSDIKNHRVTLPILYALENSSAREQDILCAIFQNDSFNGDLVDAHKQVTALLHSTDAIARAEQTVLSLLEGAVEQLQHLPPGEGRDYLETISQALLRRKL